MLSLLPFLLLLFLTLAYCLPPVTTPPNTQGHSPPKESVCRTEGCLNAASELIGSIDKSVDPCSDFYHFVCGNYIKDTVIPDHKSNTGTISQVVDTLNKRLRPIFESNRGTSEPEAYQNVRNLYKSCMSTDDINKNSLPELMEIFQKIGGWPVLDGDGWNGANFQWMESAILAMKNGFSFELFIDIGIVTDAKDSTKRILHIDEPYLGLSPDYLVKGFEDKGVKAYYRYMVDLAVFFGASKDTASDEMKEALNLEIELAKISLPQEERRNKTALYNPMTVKEISALYPLPWSQYLNSIVPLLEDDLVNVAVPDYLKSLNILLASTPVRTIANLMMWRHAQFSVDFLAEKAGDIKLEFDKVIRGQASKLPRWETCVKKTAGDGEPDYYLYNGEGSLINAVGAMYAKKHFPETTIQIVDDIVENIRAEFRLILEELDWMDEKTRTKALKKADFITPHIAYPKEILDDDLIENYFDGLTLGDTSYLKNILQLKQWIFAYYQMEFRKPIDKHSWKTHGGAAVANAYYNAQENSIVFPAGIIDGVFFDKDRPLYMNYGGIGFVVGHEITHGFDDQGCQKNVEGNLEDWWQAETKQKYLEKTQCVIDQYRNYTVKVGEETLNINGIKTQGENVADISGVKEALRGYMRFARRSGEEQRLPGLPYSPRQLFWVSYARFQCERRRPAALKDQVLTDPHSPARFRINGPLEDQPEFSEDWSCPLGSPMNPANKCQVW